MSQRQISRRSDLQHLRNEGYDIEIRAGHLLVKGIPYVNEKKEVKRGTLISILEVNGDITQRPADHTVRFAGEYPCDKNGMQITKIVNAVGTQEIIPGVVINYSFSSKPASGYVDYYEKITTYANILSSQAAALDSSVTHKTRPVIIDDDEESVFHYMDDASARIGIVTVTAKLSNLKVAIVGLGGTGAYILDLVAKTPVREIHLYDGDDFLQHNAFRAPGAASIDDLNKSKKVDYYFTIYSRMRKYIITHPYNIDETNIDELTTVGFVFLCVDGGQIKRAMVDRLNAFSIPFIDCGIGVYSTDEKLGGIVRVTTSTSIKNDHVLKRVMDKDDGDNEYAQNIQIADLNALNAVLAVIKWKKLFGFYSDFDNEHHTTYIIDGNTLANEECL